MEKQEDSIFKVLNPKQWNELPDTLLVRYFQQEIANYSEPERKGTPKGYSIGMSKEKYIACLFMMTNLLQKDIASKLGISFGVLRVWSTEQVCKDLTEKNCSVFAEIVMKYFELEIDAFYEEGKKRFILGEEPLMPSFAAVGDFNIYGNVLLKKIANRYQSFVDRLKDSKMMSREEIYKTITVVQAFQSQFGNMNRTAKSYWIQVQGATVKTMIDNYTQTIASEKEQLNPQSQMVAGLIKQYIDSLLDLCSKK